ncbi:hypothetical protein CEXT_771831 [Caerostris extrusa]|uniref:Uncharacterized protein n=1 Tax=Caerostris extrusa TaxID=172846 RepID=A0AAV4URN6_CAEEX|nr:hypothetical protein CEXT_771831 [Caerostris extrusa]
MVWGVSPGMDWDPWSPFMIFERQDSSQVQGKTPLKCKARLLSSARQDSSQVQGKDFLSRVCLLRKTNL